MFKVLLLFLFFSFGFILNESYFFSFYSSAKGKKKKDVISLAYDLTPAELIDMVVTEFGKLPTTSVPVIMREFRADQALM